MNSNTRLWIFGTAVLLALVLWGASHGANVANAQHPGPGSLAVSAPGKAQVPQVKQGAPKGDSKSGPAAPLLTATPTPIICDNLSYTYTSSTGATIVPGTTNIGLLCDHCITSVALPFPYRLYGQTFTSVNVSTAGNLQFSSADTADSNSCLPYSAFNYAIVPYWDSALVMTFGSGMFTSVSGSAPNRIFNIEWRVTYIFGSSVNFEARLYEGQSRFDFIYGTMNGHTGSSARVGVQKGTGSLYTQFECNTGGLSNGLQLTFTQLACVTATPTLTLTPTMTPTSTVTPTATATPCNANTFLNQGFETGLGSFVSTVATCAPGGCGWSAVTSDKHSGSQSAFAPDLNNISDQSLELTNDYAVPAGASSWVLSFWHRVNLENTYDGGVLEFSTDFGATWGTSNPTFISGGYNGTINSSYGNPIGGRQAWTGSIGAAGSFVQVQVNLAAHIGASYPLRFRFREGNDDQAGAPGWWIDDVQMSASYACTTSTPTRTPTVTNTNTPSPTATIPACGPGSNYVIASATATIIAGTSLVPGSQDDDATVNIALPFTYNFYGVPYTSVNASTNGNLQFTSNDSTYINSCVPAGGMSNLIAPYWDDLLTLLNGGDGIYTSMTGTVGSRVFAIEWHGCIYNGGSCGGNVNFEVLLYEGQNRLDFVYGVVTDNGGPHGTGDTGATVGVQFGTGQLSTQFSCNTASLSTGLRLIFTEPSCPTSTPTATSTPTLTNTSTVTITPTSCSAGVNYVVATATATIIAGTSLVPGSQADDAMVNIALPFTYNFYGAPYTSVNASTNGNLQFTSNDIAYTNVCLPAGAMNNLIAPHWDDLLTNQNGGIDGIYTSVTGTVGSRVFAIEWRGCIYSNVGCAGNVNFEALLYEGQDRFDFVYGVVTDNGGSHSTGDAGAMIGVQYGTGPQSTQFSCNTASLSTGLRLTFTEPACVTLTPTATSTPAITLTPTRTNTSTPSITSTPTQVLVGHVTWQGRPAQPNALQQVPVTLTLRLGATEVNYPAQTTDASGFFTVSVGSLQSGAYNWRVKGTKWLANSGTVALGGGPTTQREMGLLKAGDCNDDNAIGVLDFNVLKGTFAKAQGDPGYDDRGDLTGDVTVNVQDFNLLKTNFGQGGAPPINPINP